MFHRIMASLLAAALVSGLPAHVAQAQAGASCVQREAVSSSEEDDLGGDHPGAFGRIHLAAISGMPGSFGRRHVDSVGIADHHGLPGVGHDDRNRRHDDGLGGDE